MTVTLYEKKQNLGTLGAQLKKVNEEIAMKAGDPTVADKDLMQLQEQSESLEKRYNMLKEQVEREEAEQRAKFTKTKTPTMTAEEKLIHAKAEFYRGQSLSSDYKQVLGDDDSTTNGSKLLPVTIANDIIAEPTDKNPLREDELVTAVTNLERPRIDVTIDDDSFVNDQEVAKEIQAKGDTVKFGRNKTKLKVAISEAILNGTDTNLVEHVNAQLQGGLARKEKAVAFAETPKSGEEEMSFYSTQNKIKKVTGETMFDAIIQAAGDIADDFQSDIKIYMTRQDYVKMIKELSNGSVSLFGKAPEEVLGYPVRFTELAKKPVVGNFKYAQLNYEISSALYEQWKDYDKGVNNFQLTAWFDHKILLASAFRIADVTSK
ncbi:phage major capsid protein [Ligilactobacillus salivarius]|uniref:Major capsid protein n=1 Tax=Ligilactobacillus salivarius TaxID=1624 RepID=A0A1D7TSP2_9LACO|nr:phage major capsid protein [Ligilactobacillus salivarius]AOO73985.1 major capsid protein [Ligilactobacillus salivarius]UDE97952.1 phage major capsid protein [Ligilactobacillus salivarius]UUV97069.1 phage major capsid protein [Ligilactobacillus salivarius]